MDKAAPGLPNEPEEEEKLEDLTFTCNGGTEYELQLTVPPHLEEYRIAHAIPHYYHGPWGAALFKKIPGEYGNAWDNRCFPVHDVEISAVYPRPVYEMHASITGSFACVFNGLEVPAA